MADINLYREGNLIEYWGVGSQQIARIIKINAEEESGSFIIEAIHTYKEEYKVLEKEIRPVFFRDYHIKQLGFVFDEKTRRNELNGLTIAYYGEIIGIDPFKLIGKHTNYYILPVGFPLRPTNEQLKLATEIPYLHSLQNYCSDNGIEIDFGKIV
jgi:hypothetical protein